MTHSNPLDPATGACPLYPHQRPPLDPAKEGVLGCA